MVIIWVKGSKIRNQRCFTQCVMRRSIVSPQSNGCGMGIGESLEFLQRFGGGFGWIFVGNEQRIWKREPVSRRVLDRNLRTCVHDAIFCDVKIKCGKGLGVWIQGVVKMGTENMGQNCQCRWQSPIPILFEHPLPSLIRVAILKDLCQGEVKHVRETWQELATGRVGRATIHSRGSRRDMGVGRNVEFRWRFNQSGRV